MRPILLLPVALVAVVPLTACQEGRHALEGLAAQRDAYDLWKAKALLDRLCGVSLDAFNSLPATTQKLLIVQCDLNTEVVKPPSQAPAPAPVAPAPAPAPVPPPATPAPPLPPVVIEPDDGSLDDELPPLPSRLTAPEPPAVPPGLVLAIELCPRDGRGDCVPVERRLPAGMACMDPGYVATVRREAARVGYRVATWHCERAA